MHRRGPDPQGVTRSKRLLVKSQITKAALALWAWREAAARTFGEAAIRDNRMNTVIV